MRKMKLEIASLVRRLRRDERGAVVVLVSIMIVALIGLGALAIDIGNIAFAQRRLQAATDMAAQSGAAVMNWPSSAVTAATTYSATSTGKNILHGLTVTMASGSPQLIAVNGTSAGGCPTGTELTQYPGCIRTGPNSGCAAVGTNPAGCNAIVVTQQATVPFLLSQVFGFGSVHLSATSRALAKGGFPPLNVMIVIDTTDSMKDVDPYATTATCGSAGASRLQCAMFGVRILLAQLSPTQDQVGLMVFPQVSTGTVSDDSSCNTNPTPTTESYNATSGATYQIVGVTNTYQSTNSPGTLDGNSQLANAVQYGPNGKSCSGVKVVAGQGTYFAAAITAAQCALAGCGTTPGSDTTGVCATLHCQNVIILLGDGGAGNATGTANTNATTAAHSSTLHFAVGSLPTVTPVVGSPVCDSANVLPSCNGSNANPATVTAINYTTGTVTISQQIASGKTLPSGDQITFEPYNQCNQAIAAASTAAGEGTWVYSIAYGASTVKSTKWPADENNGSCSDTESPVQSSCTTMQQIASDPSKFYSDGSGGSASCTSVNTAADLGSIFQQIANSLLLFTVLLPPTN